MKKENLTLLTDFYELTMANGYFQENYQDVVGYFDIFFRKVPDEGGYAIFCGLEQMIDYVMNLHFDDSDIDYLRGLNIFSEGFLEYLRNFKFSGDIYAVPEGTLVFPYEPIITVRAKTIEAQLVETYLLLQFNHQTLIATKANRIVRAAKGRAVMEFGARRSQGEGAANLGARAAVIAGCACTSNTLAGKMFNIPVSGTMAHSWVQMFKSEYDAFKKYCEVYGDGSSLLIDTYDVLKSGLPTAIKVFKEVLVPQGFKKMSVRIDSGDMAYLTKKIRQTLDEAGLPTCKIIVSNSLDEHIITALLDQGAQIDSFGVGERLITSKSDPVLGGVYKLAAVERDGVVFPKIKISENAEKITTPGFKEVYRIFDNQSNKAIADLVCLKDEVIPTDKYTLFDPLEPWKEKEITNYRLEKITKPIFIDGALVYERKTVKQIQENLKNSLEGFWPEVLRFVNPHTYYVDLSSKLYDLKQDLLYSHHKGNKNK